MTLSFTATGDNALEHDFSCDPANLEDALDILNIIVFQGHTLVRAHIVDEDGRTELPLEVFDGQPLSSSMKKLEKQWRAILKKPIRSSSLVHNHWKQDINRRRIRLYDSKIAYFDEVITKLKQQTQLPQNKVYSYQIQYEFCAHYASLITMYEGYMERAKTRRELILKTLI